MTPVLKVVFISIIMSGVALAQSLFSGPECIMLDEARDRYLISNYHNGTIVSLDMDGNQTLFKTGLTQCLSFDIHGDSLFISTGTSVTILDLNTAATISTIAITGSVGLDGLLYHEDHLYALGTNSTVFKIRLSDETYWPWIQGAFPGQPQDITFDRMNDRMILCTYNGSKTLWSIQIADSSVSPIIDTEIGGFDGMAMDHQGNLYISSWSTGAIHMYNDEFVHPPVTVFSSSSGAANISIIERDTLLALPLFDEDTIFIIPLPNDYIGIRVDAEPKAGETPLQVQFTDHSYAAPPLENWNWDIDSDGEVDLNGPNPVGTYTSPGIYSVSVNVDNSNRSSHQLVEDMIHVNDPGETGLFFNGRTSHSISDTAMNLNPLNTVSVTAWIYPLGWGSDQVYGGGIISKGAFWFSMSKNATSQDQQTLFLQLFHESGPPSYHQASINAIWLDNWMHVAMSYDSGSSEVKMYVNGSPVEVTSVGAGNGPLADMSLNPVTIGSIGNTRSFHGVLDEVSLWEVVLDESAIQALMNQGINAADVGLLAAWDMNQGTGSIVEDLVGDVDIQLYETMWSMGTNHTFTSLDDSDKSSLPESPLLLNAYPNPFNPTTTIIYDLPEYSVVKLTVFDIQGREVMTLHNGEKFPGKHEVQWDGIDQSGNPVSTGMYFCRLHVGDFSQTIKMVYLR